MTTMYTPDHEWINIEDHEAAVVGIPDDRWGEAVTACVIPATPGEFDEQAVIAFARERLTKL